MTDTLEPEILSINALLEKKNLTIPPYQRPYKWTTKNIETLLNDIKGAINDSKKYSNFKYRIGTIIIHKDKDDEKLKIVDGQQRIISLALISKCLEMELNSKIFEIQFDNKTTQSNIHENYKYIEQWFNKISNKQDAINKFIGAFENILEVVVLYVGEVEEAFQLFDSQNTRGKSLDPTDLLKAYHLRVMNNNPYEMKRAVKKWENISPKDIQKIFKFYLYPILNWSRGLKNFDFTSKDIDIYKGIEENSDYTYAKRTLKASPYFQITEPFIAGKDFFEMVAHYIELEKDIESYLNSTEIDINIKEWAQSTDGRLSYSQNLFKCVLLRYYDKFNNFDSRAVKNIFAWSMRPRIETDRLGRTSINNYAIGGNSLFSIINYARYHSEISNLNIKSKFTLEQIKKITIAKKIRQQLFELINREIIK